MKYFHDISSLPTIHNSIVTVGIFDGIHKGHKALFDKMKEIKLQTGGDIVVITFHPHPKLILDDNCNHVNYLHSTGRKTDLLAHLGVDILIDINFTKEFSQIPTKTFLSNYIINSLHPAYIVVGYDCHFGHGNENTIDILKQYSNKYNYQIIQVPPIYFNNQIISSSAIRSALKSGDIETANNMLGYEYSIYGQVVYGRQIGRTIGFPTVNLFIENDLKLIAANGVYACKIKWHQNMYYGMCNIGTRPTVNGNSLTIEVNIFDFSEDIYGENICILFCKRIRSEHKFDNIIELKEQLEKDKILIKNYFKKY